MSDAARGGGAANGFQAGFAARHDNAARALAEAFAPRGGFAPREVRSRRHDDPPARPRHFSPADPCAKPTAGWDPFDASATDMPEPPVPDAIAAAHAAGYAEGLAAAGAAATAAAERDRQLLSGLLAQLGGADRLDRDRIARQLRETVLFLTSKLVGEVGVAADILTQRVEAAAELLADSAESALLRVHPDDVSLLEGRLPTTIFQVGDAGLARGSFVLESASTVVEDGPALWLEQLAHAIETAAVPDAKPAC